MSNQQQQLTGIELGKQQAAHRAVDENVQSNQIIGIGSGSTVVYAVQRISELYNNNKLTNIQCIATSFQSELLILDYNLPLTQLNRHSIVDVCIDGSDECDSKLNCIKGGGGCQLQEKLVASNSKLFVIIADYRKNSDLLGTQWNKGIPLEVVPSAYMAIMHKLEQLGSKPILRQSGSSKAGPVVTDNGNFIIDANFGQIDVNDVSKLNDILQHISGMVETGLFVNMASKAYFGDEQGNVIIRENNDAIAMGMHDPNNANRIKFGSLHKQ